MMANQPRPVIVLHGLFDPGIRVAPLVRGLIARGLPVVRTARVPALGVLPLELLASRFGEFVRRTQSELGAASVDVVGFSMGALVARVYLQELAGHRHVRTFVSIAGPHGGTRLARALPLRGVRQMRPGSELLTRLGMDVSHLPSVRVHCLYTPHDSIIVPPESGVLRGARGVHELAARAHHHILRDAAVHDLVAAILREEQVLDEAAAHA
jgi:triacylglycerol lipase